MPVLGGGGDFIPLGGNWLSLGGGSLGAGGEEDGLKMG